MMAGLSIVTIRGRKSLFNTGLGSWGTDGEASFYKLRKKPLITKIFLHGSLNGDMMSPYD